MSTALQLVQEGGELLHGNSAQEMSAHLVEVKKTLDVVQTFFKEVMVKGEDYGVIPGTDKPALLKPGAEKLCELYGYAPTMRDKEIARDVESGFYEATVTMALVSRKTGEMVAEGVGSANTHESRYRYRWVFDNQIPKGINKADLVSEERKSKKTGKSWTMYRIENADPWSLWNTVLKMAKKRALVDVALSATRSSGLFTQDPEAFDKWVDEAKVIDGEFAEVDERPNTQRPPRRGQNRSDAPPAAPEEPEEPAIPVWTKADLDAVLKEKAIALADLSGVLGAECNKDTFPDLIDPWLRAHAGSTLEDLANAAVAFHMNGGAQQPALT